MQFNEKCNKYFKCTQTHKEHFVSSLTCVYIYVSFCSYFYMHDEHM